jgi:hypothetical protein
VSNRRKLNLDESRKARAEKQGEGPEFVLGGKTFALPAKAPAAVFVGIGEAQEGNLRSFALAVRMLFGDKTDEVLAAGLDQDDLSDLLKLYNEDDDEGESAASGD